MEAEGPIVRWVTGRRTALARAIAIYSTETRGIRWMDLTQGARDREVELAERAVREWVAHKVLAEFAHPYREADDGGKPIGNKAKVRSS